MIVEGPPAAGARLPSIRKRNPGAGYVEWVCPALWSYSRPWAGLVEGLAHLEPKRGRRLLALAGALYP